MSTKRQPSKQRRQTQNQRQRAALQARTAAASEAPPTGKVGGDTAPAKSGSVLSRLTGTGGSSSAGGTTRGRAAAANLPVGHRAALTAVVLAGASVLFVIFAFRVPIGAGGEPIVTATDRVAEWSRAALDEARSLDDPTADAVRDAVDDWSPNGRERYVTALFPQSLAILLPLIAAGLGFRAVRDRRPAKIINRAMYATMFGALLTVELLVFFIPTVVSMAVASFQVRKYEFATKAAAEAAAPAPTDPPADDVIDVDEVDEVDVDEVDEVDEEKPAP